MYSLLTWVHEPFEEEIVYSSDCGGFSITAEYSSSPLEFESDAKNWQLLDHNGRVIKSFDTLANAIAYANSLNT